VLGNGTGEIAYVALRLHGPEASIETPSDWHEHRRAWVRLGFGVLTVAFSFPWYGKIPKDDGQCSGPRYGFSFFGDMLWIYTGKSTSHKGKWITITMPWAWKHVRHSYLRIDGTRHHDAVQGDYEAPEDTRQTFSYTYTRRSGEVQDRTATINGEEREWRLHYCPWLPWPRKLVRSININFSDEVGERSGSWKGGTIGCGWDWKHGETQEQSLRRMERERKL